MDDDEVYCSPSCGFKCTKRAYDRAVKEAAELAARMGDGWEARVWENWGWNYKAVKGLASVSPTMTKGSSIRGDWIVGGYSCYFNTRSKQFIAKADAPEDALGFAIQDARTAIERMRQDCEDVLEIEPRTTLKDTADG